jgi:hypothetical protein
MIMFKYTPNKFLSDKVSDKKKGYSYIRQNITTEYQEVCALRRYYPFVEFYAKGRQIKIPVNGFLFDSSLFIEEEV